MSLRDSIRATIFSNADNKRRTVKTTFLGAEIELKQPSTGDMLALQRDFENGVNIVRSLITYAYVPGTDDRLFSDADYESLLALPYNDEMVRLVEALNALFTVDIADAEKNSDAPRLSGM